MTRARLRLSLKRSAGAMCFSAKGRADGNRESFAPLEFFEALRLTSRIDFCWIQTGLQKMSTTLSLKWILVCKGKDTMGCPLKATLI